MLRHFKPKHLIEIGSGYSSACALDTIDLNLHTGVQCTFIDPFPELLLSLLKSSDLCQVRIIDKPVQETDIEVFDILDMNDILFIDSTHVVSVDSDVLYECLRILPELAEGVLVHLHDIFTPFDYPQKFVMTNLCFWGEQYMLEAFLSFNRAFRVMWSASALQHEHWNELEAAFPAWKDSYTRMPAQLKIYAPTLDGKNVWPNSFWIERAAR